MLAQCKDIITYVPRRSLDPSTPFSSNSMASSTRRPRPPSTLPTLPLQASSLASCCSASFRTTGLAPTRCSSRPLSSSSSPHWRPARTTKATRLACSTCSLLGDSLSVLVSEVSSISTAMHTQVTNRDSTGEYPAGSVGCAESTGELKKGTRHRWFILFTNTMINGGFVIGAFVPCKPL